MSILMLFNHAFALTLPTSTPSPRNPFQKPAPASSTAQIFRKAPHPITVGYWLLGAFTCYGIFVYKDSVIPEGVDPATLDVSYRYNATASTFDREVDFWERYSGIIKMRRELVQQARGNVLEAAVGTGRNSAFYESDRIKSLTLLDQSKEMMAVARSKWQEDGQCRFITQSALEPLPPPPRPEEEQVEVGYDTIIATMSLCSTPMPELFLRSLASGLADRSICTDASSAASTDSDKTLPSRILLLEHGRSYYSWMNKFLDWTAPGHALHYGCWWNRDIGQIAEHSGLEIIRIRRKHFGTTWWLELGLPIEAKGAKRQQWMEDTRSKIAATKAELEQKQGQVGKEMKKQDEERRQAAELEEWRREQREQMKRGKP
ncbi:MAG: hypothetical protein Q9207_005970 [Kuettlingeria erythrocarpa]